VYIDLVIIAIKSPLYIGIYENEELVETLKFEGKTSETLPVEFQKVYKKYKIRRVLFANGPGSFMAIKINYIFLKTISTVSGIELFGVDGFFFNSNTPIEAMNGMVFVKRDDEIVLEKGTVESSFKLPKRFEVENYSKDIEPLYIIPAI
jgi:tRNA A37 threonylcarbamoyladenosine modification protein TsaB